MILNTLLLLLGINPIVTNQFDELYIQRMMDAGSLGARTLIASLQLDQGQPGLRLDLIDLEERSLREIKDGRLPHLIRAILPLSDRFLLISRSPGSAPVLVFLDHQAQFLEQVRLDRFKNWPAHFSLTHAAVWQEGLLLSGKEFDRADQSQFLRVDLVNRSVSRLFSRPNPENFSQYLVPGDGFFYNLNGQLAEVKALDMATGTHLTTLKPGQAPVLRPSHKTHLLKRNDPRISAYISVFFGSFQCGKNQYIPFDQLRDEFGNPLEKMKKRFLRLTNQEWEIVDTAILNTTDHMQLVYSCREGNLRLQPRSTLAKWVFKNHQ